MHTTTAFAARLKPVRGLDFLFTLGRPKSPLGCLPLSLYTFLEYRFRGLARDYHATGFHEFDRYSRTGFPLRSPLQNQLPRVAIGGRLRLTLALAGFHQMYLAGVAGEHCHRKYVEQVAICQVDRREIEIGPAVPPPDHDAPAGPGSPTI